MFLTTKSWVTFPKEKKEKNSLTVIKDLNQFFIFPSVMPDNPSRLREIPPSLMLELVASPHLFVMQAG